MRLATLNDQTRDGQLVVVSHDLRLAVHATDAAGTMRQALDDWDFAGPRLQALSERLNQGRARHAFAFDPAAALAPLPRTWRWHHADAWAAAGDRASGLPVDERRAAASDAGGGAPSALPAGALQCCDRLFGGHVAPVLPASAAAWTGDATGLDVEPGLAVVLGDGAPGVPRLWLGIVRWLLPPADAGDETDDVDHADDAAPAAPRRVPAPRRVVAIGCAPVACTTDEFGDDWRGGRLCCRLEVSVHGRRIGRLLTGDDLVAPWPRWIDASTGDGCAAGTVVSAGPVRNGDRARGHAGLAAARAEAGASVPWHAPGARLRIQWLDDDGRSWFGSVEPAAAAGGTGASAPAGAAGSSR